MGSVDASRSCPLGHVPCLHIGVSVQADDNMIERRACMHAQPHVQQVVAELANKEFGRHSRDGLQMHHSDEVTIAWKWRKEPVAVGTAQQRDVWRPPRPCPQSPPQLWGARPKMGTPAPSSVAAPPGQAARVAQDPRPRPRSGDVPSMSRRVVRTWPKVAHRKRSGARASGGLVGRTDETRSWEPEACDARGLGWAARPCARPGGWGRW